MGSRTVPACGIALLVALLAAGAAPATGQGSSTSPTKLWEFNPPGSGVFGDVAIDANGLVAAAVMSDAGALDFGDNEVFVWDLARAPESAEPVLAHDPRGGTTVPPAPEGLGVVALAPSPSGKADFMAVGREGPASDTTNDNRVYVYQISRNTRTLATYGSGDEAGLDSAILAIWFNEIGDRFVARQEGGLALLKKVSGTEFGQKHRWVPPTDEVITAVAVARDLRLVLVATTDTDPIAADQNRIHLLKISSDDKFVDGGDTELRVEEGDSAFTALAVSADVRYVVAGTEDRVVFYWELQSDSTGLRKFSSAWSQTTPAAVTAVGIADDGLTFGAGFSSPSLLLYRQISLETDGPLAERAIKAPFATAAAPSHIVFANGDKTILAVGGALYGFNEVQLDPRSELSALWLVADVADVAVSRDGNRFITSKLLAQDGIVRMYEQSYRATLSVGPTDLLTPGETETLQVTLENTGSAFDEYAVSVADVPGSWSIEVTPDTLELLPGRTGEITVKLTPDRSQPPGDLTVTVMAESTFSPEAGVAGTSDVKLTIREVHGADVDVDETVLAVERGSHARIEATLENTGNVDDAVIIEVRSQTAWPVTLDGETGSSRTFDLDAGASRIVNIEVSVPSAAAEGSVNTLTLRARPQSGGSVEEVTVKLIVEPDFGAALTGPTTLEKAEPGATVPVSVRVRNSGNTADTLALRAFSNATNPDHRWEATLSTLSLALEPGKERTVTVTVVVPRGADPGEASEVTVAARSAGSGLQEATVRFRLEVQGEEEDDGIPFPLWGVAFALAAAGLASGRRKG